MTFLLLMDLDLLIRLFYLIKYLNIYNPTTEEDEIRKFIIQEMGMERIKKYTR